MAAVTIADDFGMVHAGDGGPGTGAVAGITVIGSVDMGRRLSRRLLPIMAVVAIAYHFSMIHPQHG